MRQRIVANAQLNVNSIVFLNVETAGVPCIQNNEPTTNTGRNKVDNNSTLKLETHTRKPFNTYLSLCTTTTFPVKEKKALYLLR